MLGMFFLGRSVLAYRRDHDQAFTSAASLHQST